MVAAGNGDNERDALLISTDELIVHVNDTAVAMLYAVSSASLLGRSALDLFPSTIRSRFAAGIARLAEAGHAQALFGETCERLDGSQVKVDILISPIQWQGRGGAQITLRNASERRTLAGDPNWLGAVFQSVLSTVPDGFIVIDEQGVVQLFSTAAERSFGYDAVEVIGHSVNMLMASPHRERHDRYMERYLDTGVPHVVSVGMLSPVGAKTAVRFPSSFRSQKHEWTESVCSQALRVISPSGRNAKSASTRFNRTSSMRRACASWDKWWSRLRTKSPNRSRPSRRRGQND